MPALRSTRCGTPLGALAMALPADGGIRPGDPSPSRGRHADTHVARSRLRGVRRAEPHARAAAGVRVVQPARTDLRAGDRGHSRRLRRRCELDQLPPPRGRAWQSGPPDDGDILIDLALNDVRCVPTGARCGTANASGPADYSGELRFSFTFRLTDHWNAIAPGGGTDPATVQDFAIRTFAWACVQSGSTSTGSTCNLTTSLNAIIPGSVKDAKRAIWELDAVRIFDGGADGDGDTTADNTVFARPGIFIP